MPNYEQFKDYYEQFMPQVFGYVFMRTNQNKSMAEDLVSEIFLKAIENFEQFDEKKGTFKSWIFQVTKNYLIDHYRSKKNQESQSIDNLSNELRDKSDSQNEANSAIEKELINEAINELPESKKELILLRYFAGYSHEEIASITNETANNTRVKLHRTLEELKRKLAKLNY